MLSSKLGEASSPVHMITSRGKSRTGSRPARYAFFASVSAIPGVQKSPVTGSVRISWSARGNPTIAECVEFARTADTDDTGIRMILENRRIVDGQGHVIVQRIGVATRTRSAYSGRAGCLVEDPRIVHRPGQHPRHRLAQVVL